MIPGGLSEAQAKHEKPARVLHSDWSSPFKNTVVMEPSPFHARSLCHQDLASMAAACLTSNKVLGDKYIWGQATTHSRQHKRVVLASKASEPVDTRNQRAQREHKVCIAACGISCKPVTKQLHGLTWKRGSTLRYVGMLVRGKGQRAHGNSGSRSHVLAKAQLAAVQLHVITIRCPCVHFLLLLLLHAG